MSRCFSLLGLVSFLVGLPAFGTTAASKPRVVVLDFKPVGDVDPGVLSAFSEKLLMALRTSESYEELGKNDFEAMVGYERFKDALGCDDVSCMADIAGAAGVDLLLTGTVLRDEGVYTVLAKLVNTRKATIESRVEHRVLGGVTALLDSAEIVIAKAFSQEDWLQKITGGSIEPKVNAAGAEVFIDGESKGKDTGTLFGITPGPHEVMAKLEGWRPFATTVTVEKGKSTPVDITLVQLATLEIVSVPAGADVVLNGDEIGRTPKLLIGREAGHYEVRLSMDGYATQEVEIDIEDGRQETIEVNLVTIAQHQIVVGKIEAQRSANWTWVWASLGATAGLGGVGAIMFALMGDGSSIRASENAGSAIDQHNAMVGVGWGCMAAAGLSGAFAIYMLLSMPSLTDVAVSAAPTNSGVVVFVGGHF